MRTARSSKAKKSTLGWGTSIGGQGALARSSFGCVRVLNMSSGFSSLLSSALFLSSTTGQLIPSSSIIMRAMSSSKRLSSSLRGPPSELIRFRGNAEVPDDPEGSSCSFKMPVIRMRSNNTGALRPRQRDTSSWGMSHGSREERGVSLGDQEFRKLWVSGTTAGHKQYEDEERSETEGARQK